MATVRDKPTRSRTAGGGVCARCAATLVLALSLVSESSAQEKPSVGCSARLVGDRVLVSLTLRGFLDEETLRLVRLGLVGRVRVEAGVHRKRWLFEQTLAQEQSDAQIAYARTERRLLVNGRGLSDAGTVALPVQAVRVGSGQSGPGLVVRAEVRLQVVTVASLSKVAAWATGADGKDEPSDVLTRGLLSAVVEDLTRSAECSCRVEAAPEGR